MTHWVIPICYQQSGQFIVLETKGGYHKAYTAGASYHTVANVDRRGCGLDAHVYAL